MIKKCFSQSLNNDGRVAFNERQCLTSAQKEVARKNIGLEHVASEEDVKELSRRVDNVEDNIANISTDLDNTKSQVETNTDDISRLQEDVIKAKSTVAAGKNIEVEEEIMDDGHTKYTISAKEAGSVLEVIPEDWGITVGDMERDENHHYTEAQYDMMYNNIKGVYDAIVYAYENGYISIRFPQESVICLTPVSNYTDEEGKVHGATLIGFYNFSRNFVIDFNSSTIKVKLDSAQKSKYYNSDITTTWKYGYGIFGIEHCRDLTIKNLNAIGGYIERDFTEASEANQESGSVFNIGHGSYNIHCENIHESYFEGDMLNTPVYSQGVKNYCFINTNSTLDDKIVRVSNLDVKRFLEINDSGVVTDFTDDKSHAMLSSERICCTDMIAIPEDIISTAFKTDEGYRITWDYTGIGYEYHTQNISLDSRDNYIYFYDENQNYISRTKIGYQNAVLMPSNTRYIRLAPIGIPVIDTDGNYLSETIRQPAVFTCTFNDEIYIENSSAYNNQRGCFITRGYNFYIRNFNLDKKRVRGFTSDCYFISNEDQTSGYWHLDNVQISSSCYTFSKRILMTYGNAKFDIINCENITLVPKRNKINVRDSIIGYGDSYLPNQYDTESNRRLPEIYFENVEITGMPWQEFKNRYQNVNGTNIMNTAVDNANAFSFTEKYDIDKTKVIPVFERNDNLSLRTTRTITLTGEEVTILPNNSITKDNCVPDVTGNVNPVTIVALEEHVKRIVNLAGQPVVVQIRQRSANAITKINNYDGYLQYGYARCPMIPANSSGELIIANSKLKIASIHFDIYISNRLNPTDGRKIYITVKDSTIMVPEGITKMGVPISVPTFFKTSAVDTFASLTYDNVDINTDYLCFMPYQERNSNAFQYSDGNYNYYIRPVIFRNCKSLENKKFASYDGSAYPYGWLDGKYAYKTRGNFDERPLFVEDGFAYFDTDLNKFIYKNGFAYDQSFRGKTLEEQYNNHFTRFPKPKWIDTEGNDVTYKIHRRDIDLVTINDVNYRYFTFDNLDIMETSLEAIGESGTDFMYPSNVLSDFISIFATPYFNPNGLIRETSWIPAGWRLPTAEECQKISELFNIWAMPCISGRNQTVNDERIRLIRNDDNGIFARPGYIADGATTVSGDGVNTKNVWFMTNTYEAYECNTNTVKTDNRWVPVRLVRDHV